MPLPIVPIPINLTGVVFDNPIAVRHGFVEGVPTGLEHLLGLRWSDVQATVDTGSLTQTNVPHGFNLEYIVVP